MRSLRSPARQACRSARAIAQDSIRANSGAKTFPCHAPSPAVVSTRAASTTIKRRSPRRLSARLGRSHIVTHGRPAAAGRSTIMGIRRAWNSGMIGRGIVARQECRTPMTWVMTAANHAWAPGNRGATPAREARAPPAPWHGERAGCRYRTRWQRRHAPAHGCVRLRAGRTIACSPPRPRFQRNIPVIEPILSPEVPDGAEPARARITAAWLRDETEAVNDLLTQATLPAVEREQVIDLAADLVTRVRARAKDQSAVESFMRQYDLSSEEGVLLMCVAEALLRIPDKTTADKLIRDKLGDANWKKHLGQSESLFVNASTWGLMLTGKLVNLAEETRHDFTGALKRLVARAGEPAIRLAVRQAMRIMGHQFVMGRTIDEALDRCAKKEYAMYRYSYDMLGESALTAETAERYQEDYRRAIARIGARGPFANHTDAPSISVKLSALHPRYEVANRADARRDLTAKLLELSQLAMKQGIALSVDAEEADRLELSLDIIGDVFAHPSLEGWNGLGIVVQAYSKRTPFVIDWLIETARASGRRWYVRLVKGAYWDAEIKRAQENGLCEIGR